MNYSFTIYSIFFLATTVVSFLVSYLAWRRRLVKGGTELTMLMIAAGVWSFFIIFETAATTQIWKIFWSKLGYIGAVTTPVLYFIFVLRFTGKDKLLTIKNIVMLFIIPAFTLLMAAFNEHHGLIWSGYSAISQSTNIIEYYHGIWFWVGYLGYNYVLLLLATVLLLGFIVNKPKTFRSQGVIVFIAGLCPWIASVIYLTESNPVPGLDLTPVSIILSGTLFVYAIMYIRLLDLVPVARETLVETLPDGILALDGQNRVQDINSAARNFLGITNKNILGLSAELTGATVNLLLNAVIDDKPVEQIEMQTDNGIITYRITKQIIISQPDSRLVVISDISDEVARQKEILVMEERYHSMVTLFRLMADNMSDMLWAKDLNKKFIFANRSVCENLLSATDIEEPIGKTDMFFANRERQKHPERNDWYTFGELCMDSDKVVIQSKKQERFEEYGNVKGEFLFLDVRKAPIFDEKGEMIGVVGSARDVTIQKKTESDIQKRDLLLDAIAKATVMLVQGEDLEEGIQRALDVIGKATEVNRVYIFRNHYESGFTMPLMSQIYEWTDGSVEPQIDNADLQNLPYETSLPRWFEELSNGNVIVGNISEFPESEKIILEPQGIKSILVTPVSLDNNLWGFIGFDECNIEREWSQTERQLLTAAANTIGTAYLRKINRDELIAAKERAEESDRLKSSFLSNMGHEIRTPMNGILGFAELLKEPGLSGENQQECIENIVKSGARMLNIINDILSISKIESGLMKVSFSETNVNEEIASICKFFRPEAEEKGVSLSFISTLSSEDASIMTDREKFDKIITNLVKNAIKFTHKGSIDIGYEKKDKYLEFYVKDTGMGIRKEQQSVIFERFRQGSESLTRNYEGAGLGLSISKAYVEMLDGKLWVESEFEKGSIFYFTIPYSIT